MATKQARGKEYGKDATANPAVSKYARLSERDAGVPITWEDVDGRLIKAALVAATEDGAALIFSKTSDGGALSITVLAGAARDKLYAKSVEAAEATLREIATLASS
jgi:hypothetical protein